MKKSLAWFFLATIGLFFLAACSSNSGGDSKSTGTIPDPAGPPATISLQSIQDGGSFIVRATVLDSKGDTVNDGTPVSFSVDNQIDDLSPLETVTSNGIAEATYTPDEETSAATVTATTQNGTTDSVTVKILGAPATVIVSHNIPPGTVLSEGGTATITAFVQDANGNIVGDGTEVFFTSSAFGSSVTSPGLTLNGFATAEFDAGTSTGAVTITATTKLNPKTGTSAQGTVQVLVSSGDAETISYAGSTPQFIGVKGTGQQESAELFFDVFDIGGNPVPDGTEISFRISQPLNGGEKLQSTNAFTTDGRVSARLLSGTVAGTVAVRAEFTSVSTGTTVGTEGKISIASGPPDAEHMTMAVAILNQAGGVWIGLNNTITAVLADRFGNIVKDGTPVNFITDCGRVGVNTVDPSPVDPGNQQAIDPFTTTTLVGTASAQSSTSNPLYSIPLNSYCTYLAYTPGNESFNDLNGDGIFNGNDVCTADLSEPYIDEPPQNGQYDSGEIYIDANQNGHFDVADGTCGTGIIWDTIRTTWSHQVGPLNITPAMGFDLQIGESTTYTFDVADVFGHALVSGTQISVTKDCDQGKLTGTTGFTLPDIFGEGQTYSFTISSDLAEDAEQVVCEITVTITSSGSSPDGNVNSNEQGNNGSTVFTKIAGILNSTPVAPPDSDPPAVDFTIPGNGQTGVGSNAAITITFDEPMDPLTVTTATVSLSSGGNALALGAPTASNGNKTFTFAPNGGMASGLHTMTISRNVRDVAGNNMAADYTFSFTVAAPPPAP